MKVIIPVAGMGKRLRPLTHTAPKVLLQVAGKPILGHILDEISKLDDVSSVTFIIGYMGDKIQQYVESNYSFEAHFVTQKEMLGLGHAIYLSAEHNRGDEPILIILGDTIIRTDFAKIFTSRHSCIGVMEVEDPTRFGIVELSGEFVKRLIEKPDPPPSNLAIVGIYYLLNPSLLFDSLDHIVANNIRTKDEYQLTDALQSMLDKGEKMTSFAVEGWFDCGKPETLLATNRALLELKPDRSTCISPDCYKQSILIPPVFVGEGAQISNSIIGPYSSISSRAEIRNSIIENSIIGDNATVKSVVLRETIIGNDAGIIGEAFKLNIGDNSWIDFT